MEDVIFAGTSGRAPAGPRRGHADDRQLRRRAADRLRRGVDHPADVPLRRGRVRDQRQQLPPARRPGAALGLRHRPRAARARRPGPARRDPAVAARGAAGVHRGGRGRPQAPQAQGEGAPQARGDAGQPHAPVRPHRRAAPPAQAAGPAGRGRPARRRPSRPTCATPACACSPTTWCTLRGHARRASIADEDARRGPAATRSRARWPRCGERLAALEAAVEAAERRRTPARRTPGTGSPRCRSGCAAPSQLAAERHRHLSPTAQDARAGPRPRRSSTPRPSEVRGHEATLRRREADRGPRWPRRAREQRETAEDALAAAERALVAAATRRSPTAARALARLAGQVGRCARRPAAVRPRRSSGSRRRSPRPTSAPGPRREELAAAEQESGPATAPRTEAGPRRRDLDGPTPRPRSTRRERHEAARRGRPSRRGRARRRARPRHWQARSDALALGLRRATVPARCSARRPRARGARRRWPRCCGRRRATRPRSPRRSARLADAVVVAGPDAAAARSPSCKPPTAGRAGLLVGGGAVRPTPTAGRALPDGARWAADLVRAPDELRRRRRPGARAAWSSWPTSPPPARSSRAPPTCGR